MKPLFKVATWDQVYKYIFNHYEPAFCRFKIQQLKNGVFDCSILDHEHIGSYDIVYHDESRNMVRIHCIPSMNYFEVNNFGRTRIEKENRIEILKRLETAKQFLFALCVQLNEKGDFYN